ncbi:nucleotidyltransferase domain-containing protein [Isoptericola croceus]|uniref:nucleotidyltransferase domain-containing protein n=1 Tax=Isoptericola croceus TaxID=3031406 RepID=UPI0023F79547|nr:nucleotidyltransferase domain-containing protein [Isoptericola croceus]
MATSAYKFTYMSPEDELLDRIAELSEERSAVEEHLRATLLRATASRVPQTRIASALGVSQSAISQAIATARAQALGRGPAGRAVLAHRREILTTSRRHQAHDVRVFGSVSRGEDTDASDIDFLVRMPGAGMLAVSSLAEELERVLGRPVDVLPEHLIKSDALAEVEREAVPL